ncbi:MAG: phage holin family protein [Schwartzia sp. (in: firmicutes)]
MTNEIAVFLRGLIPTQVQIEWGAIASAVGTLCSYILGWNSVLEALVFAMVIDYLSGLIAAYINPRMKLDSRKGFRGIAKKVMILLLVSLAHFIDRATGQTIIQLAVIWFFLGNEGLSIVENAANAGLPVPKKLKDTLEQLSKEKSLGKPGKE